MDTLRKIQAEFKRTKQVYENLERKTHDTENVGFGLGSVTILTEKAKLAKTSLAKIRERLVRDLPSYIVALPAAEFKSLEEILQNNDPPAPQGVQQYLSDYELQENYLKPVPLLAPQPLNPVEYESRFRNLILAHRKFQSSANYQLAIQALYAPASKTTEQAMMEHYRKGVSLTTLPRTFPKLTLEQFAAWMSAKIAAERVTDEPGSTETNRWQMEVQGDDSKLQKYVAALFASGAPLEGVAKQARIHFLALPPREAASLLAANGVPVANVITQTPNQLQALIQDQNFQARARTFYEVHQQQFAFLISRSGLDTATQGQSGLQRDVVNAFQRAVRNDISIVGVLIERMNTLSHEARSHYAQRGLISRTHLEKAVHRADKSNEVLRNVATDYRQQTDESLAKVGANLAKLQLLKLSLDQTSTG